MHAPNRDLVDRTPALVWSCRLNGDCDVVNQEWLDYTGVDWGALRGFGWLSFVHPDDREGLERRLREGRRDEREVRRKLRVRRRDGSYRVFDAWLTGMRGEHSEPVSWLGRLEEVDAEAPLVRRLREDAERFERLVEAVPGLICTYELRPDGSACFPYASSKLRDIYGVSVEEAAQDASAIFARVHPDDLSRLGASIEASLSSLSTWHGEFRYAHPEKGERYIEGFSAPVVQPDGRVVWHGVVFDVTQQHQEQQALRTAEQRAAARDAIGRALLQTHSPEEALGLLVETLCRVEDFQFGSIWVEGAEGVLRCAARWCQPHHEGALAALVDASAPGAPASADDEPVLRAALADGEPLILGEGGALTGSVFARVRRAAACGAVGVTYCRLQHDTAPRAVVELCHLSGARDTRGAVELARALASQVYLSIERVQVVRALALSEQRLAPIIEHMSEGLVVADPEHVLVHWNPAALEMHAFTNQDDLRKEVRDFATNFQLSTLDGQLVPVEQWPMSRILRGERLRGVEMRVRRLDIDWERVLGYGGSLVKQDDGRELAFLTITDLTERTRAWEELQRLNQELELRVSQRTAELTHSNRELESFSYSVSHDLRAPLRAMNGYAQILIEDHERELSPDARRAAQVICDSAKRMGVLIDDLLTLSRMGRKELHVTRVDMRALLTEVLDGTPFSGREHAHVKIGELPSCVGDAGLLRHIWMNLLSNAFKYSRNREQIEITIAGRVTADEQASYSITDNGAGFDMRYAHQLFRVFKRLHSDEEFEGTGVGLAIVERIVTRHGGRVSADSVVDHGATFSFTLPLRVAA